MPKNLKRTLQMIMGVLLTAQLTGCYVDVDHHYHPWWHHHDDAGVVVHGN